jgi:hypothetical protein
MMMNEHMNSGLWVSMRSVTGKVLSFLVPPLKFIHPPILGYIILHNGKDAKFGALRALGMEQRMSAL